MVKKRRTYTRECKLEAIQLAETSDKPIAEIECDLGLGSGQIHHWRRQLADEGEGGSQVELPTNSLSTGEIVGVYSEGQYLANGKLDIKNADPFVLTLPDRSHTSLKRRKG